MNPGVLAALADRRRMLPPETDPDRVLVMPVVLRVERSAPPPRTALLEAAARAALAVCLDPRSEPGGEWHEAVAAWVAGRIRKVTRRARGAHWAAVADVPGVTIAVAPGAAPARVGPVPDAPARVESAPDGSTGVGPAPGGPVAGQAQARALVPGAVGDSPKVVSRLQIAGTDLPPDEPGPVPPGTPVVWLNPSVTLTVGKAAAQVGHATMLLAAALDERAVARWRAAGLPCAVRTATPVRWARLGAARRPPGPVSEDDLVVTVRDAGFTEVAPGTVTCAAAWVEPTGPAHGGGGHT